MAALASSGHGSGAHFVAKFDDRHESVAAMTGHQEFAATLVGEQRDDVRPSRLPHLQPPPIRMRRDRTAPKYETSEETPHIAPMIMPRICIG